MEEKVGLFTQHAEETHRMQSIDMADDIDRNGNSQLIPKNRRHQSFLRNHRQSIVGVLLTISLVANITLIGLLAQGLTANDSFSQIPCTPEQQGSNVLKTESQVKTQAAATFATKSVVGSAPVAEADVHDDPDAICSSLKEKYCTSFHENHKRYDDSSKHYDNVFEDLSEAEIKNVYSYMSRQFHLEGFQDSVLGIELHTPNKSQALAYLDGQGPRPPRQARVMLTRKQLGVTEEYVVGPLPVPSYHYGNPRRRDNKAPIRFTPQYGVLNAYLALYRSVTPELKKLIEESYGTTFYRCKSKQCLTILPQTTSSAYTDTSIIVLAIYYATEFVTLNPVDLMFVMKETREGSEEFKVLKVFYAGKVFESVSQLIAAYRRNETPKSRMRFPKPAPHEKSLPGTVNLRGRKFPVFPQAGPKEFEPEGKRYRLKGQHVDYMEWSFNLRMSTYSGPQIWDVRWAGERIAYEISLQDIGVIYAGANPSSFYAHLSDSAFGLGNKAHGLIAGADCPEHATFIPQTVFVRNAPQIKPNAFCLFEHNTGLPLRRHKSEDDSNGRNYGGLMDRVLILRTVLVEYNYDYVFDFVFHLNGALELKTYATGFVMSQHFRHGEEPFGFRIHEDVVGSVHHHIFNFKLDIDVQGQRNRYETLDFLVDNRTWPWSSSKEDRFAQISFRHNMKSSEREAILRYNFSQPKYHIVYNDKAKNKFGNHRAYRIDSKGFSKQLLPDESPVLKSRRWSLYQMLATRRRDEEESSSSVFSMYDGDNPYVDIDRYLEDDESILDEDLVFWITVGMHHIPHTEDIPNTPTVGTEATISLMPYNYFPECPSVGARDAIRADAAGSGIVFQDYGVKKYSHCIPLNFDYENLLQKRSNVFT